jgi:hypothetical protein
MAISEYLKTCTKNIPGVRPEVYLNAISNITALTVTGNVITAMTVESGTTNLFQKVQADIDSVQFTSQGTFKSAGGYDQSLVMRLSKPRKEAITLTQQIRDQVVCGVAAIYVDNNAQAWLYGVNGATQEGFTRPINEVEISLDTGTLITDEDAQAITITLKRIGGYLPLPFNATITSWILIATAGYFAPTG